MTANIFKYIMALCAVALYSSCYKDKGNYEYTEPNKVTITGINDKYTVMQGTYLEIIPQLTPTDTTAADSARYAYEWIALKNGALITDKRKDLSTNKSLRINMALASGSYSMYYRVKDKQTGLQFQKTFDMDVVSSIYEGWMLMTEVNGAARMDMISKISGQYNVIPDVLAYVGSSLVLKGKPVNVSTFQHNPLVDGYGIFMSTDQSTDRVDPETFQYKSTYNIKYEMISNVPDNFAATSFLTTGGYRSYMISGTDAYYYYYVLNVRYGLPINILKDEAHTFKVAPFIAVNSGAQVTVFYDITNKRFVRHVSSESTCSLMPTGTMFDYNTGMDLVYMTYSSFANGNVFAILFDAVNNKYFLARFVFGASIQQVYYDEMPATGIAQAKNFAVSPDLGYIFYTVGGKLYSYDMSAKASKLMIDKGNQSFTLLQFRGNLMAASVDPSKPEGANGTLEEYNVPPVQGSLLKANSWSGVGKIISASYRSR
jgi:hypothetical protein